MEFAFIVTKLVTGQELALASAADSMLSKLDKQATKEGDCQTFPRQSRPVLQNSSFTESLTDILGLQAKDRCPNAAEESWVTVQAANCLYNF